MPTSRVFFGWWVTLAFAAMVFVSTGLRFTIGPFLKPMVADLGLDRASFSLAIAVGLFLYGACMPVMGTPCAPYRSGSWPVRWRPVASP